MHGRLKTISAALVVAAGLVLALYPWASNWLYDHATESTAGGYEAAVDSFTKDGLGEYWEAAETYNTRLLAAEVTLTDPFTAAYTACDVSYEAALDVDGSGIMCFVEIPKIDVYLPVYHGTSQEVLAKGAGHVEGTALPIGTTGGRPVISAHTGVNSSKLFSDLTDLVEGDLFFIHVLDETLAYRVVETAVIEPDDIASVTARPGRDLVTLMTCTPYGVNSHRLIVTGERTEYTEEVQEEAGTQTMDGVSEWMRAYRRALLIAFAAIGCTAAVTACVRKARKGKGKE